MFYKFYGDQEHSYLPSRREVCPVCDGGGVVDCFRGGFSASDEFAQDPDFIEDYRSGMYDARCDECNGENVIDVIDRDACPADLLARYDEQEREKYEYAMECAAEARYFGYC